MRVAAGPDLIYPYLLIRIELIRISNGAKPLVPPGAWIFASVQLPKFV